MRTSAAFFLALAGLFTAHAEVMTFELSKVTQGGIPLLDGADLAPMRTVDIRDGCLEKFRSDPTVSSPIVEFEDHPKDDVIMCGSKDFVSRFLRNFDRQLVIVEMVEPNMPKPRNQFFFTVSSAEPGPFNDPWQFEYTALPTSSAAPVPTSTAPSPTTDVDPKTQSDILISVVVEPVPSTTTTSAPAPTFTLAVVIEGPAKPLAAYSKNLANSCISKLYLDSTGLPLFDNDPLFCGPEPDVVSQFSQLFNIDNIGTKLNYGFFPNGTYAVQVQTINSPLRRDSLSTDRNVWSWLYQGVNPVPVNPAPIGDDTPKPPANVVQPGPGAPINLYKSQSVSNAVSGLSAIFAVLFAFA
ncbi:hypothetical protein BJ741DRAFT_651876 [Chytriomyces cf. hyalinus JEL632]|nr:hypothetical protein BJ741DRAFT_651876 [Chytriomyces cf. hyalinus JEL632]